MGDMKIKSNAIHIGMDFNVNPMSAVLAVIDASDVVYVFDEIEIYSSDTNEMCSEIRSRYPSQQIYIYPDPAARQRRTSAPGGVTDLSILRQPQWNFVVKIRGSHAAVRDRINAVNAKLKNASGQRTLFFLPKVKKMIRCLERQLYKEGTSQPEKDGDLDHMNDALGYMIEYLFPVRAGNSGAVDMGGL